MKFIKNIIKSNLFQIILIGIVVFVAYGLTLKMYYWVDDWGLVFKMIFPQDSPSPSNFGPGIFGQGAYRYNSTLFTWMYPLFGLNEKIYFGFALIQYFITSVFVYFLVNEFTKKKELGLVAALVFSSGYFGSFALYRLSNSYQLIETAFFLIITVLTQIKYYESKQKKYYFLSFILFTLGVELMFLRAHGMLPTVFAVAIIYGIFKYKKKIINTILELIPYSFIYFFFYFIDDRAGVMAGGPPTQALLANFVSFFKTQPITAISTFILEFKSLIIPSPLISQIRTLLKPYYNISLLHLSVLIGLVLFSIIFYLIVRYRKNKEGARLIILGLLWIVSNFVIYFLYDPRNDLPSNARYLIPSAVGTAIFYSGVFSLISHRKLKYIILVLLCGLLITYSRHEQNLIVKYVSTPDRQGFHLLKEKVKSINKDTLFLFDVIDNPYYKNYLFGNVPQMGIPPLYGENWMAKIADNVDDFISRMISGKSSVDNFESFFYGIGGHVYTTNEVRDLLKNGKNELVLTDSTNSAVNFSEYELDYPSFVPVLLTIKFNKYIYEGKIKIYWMTENRDIYIGDYSKEVNLKNLGDRYQTILPPGGRRFRKIKIEFINNSYKVAIKSITTKSLSLNELIKMNYGKK